MTARIALVLALGCGGRDVGTGDPVVDAPRADAAPSNTGVLPVWKREDVQPQSPRFGEVYGLDSFGSKIVVATLLEGF